MTPEQTRETVVHLLKVGRMTVITEVLDEIKNRADSFSVFEKLGLSVALKMLTAAMKRDVPADVVVSIVEGAKTRVSDEEPTIEQPKLDVTVMPHGTMITCRNSIGDESWYVIDGNWSYRSDTGGMWYSMRREDVRDDVLGVVERMKDKRHPSGHDFHGPADHVGENAADESDRCTSCVLGSWCKTCNGAENDLPTHCPGRRLTAEESERIVDGKLDYVDGEWVTK